MDLGVILPGFMFNRFIHPVLSFHTRLLKVVTCSPSMKTLDISLTRPWNVKTLLKQYSRDLYSLYIVERDIYIYFFLFQTTGQSKNQITKPVHPLTQVVYCFYCYGKNPENLSSKYISTYNSPDSLNIRHPSSITFRYFPMRSHEILSEPLAKCTKWSHKIKA